MQGNRAHGDRDAETTIPDGKVTRRKKKNISGFEIAVTTDRMPLYKSARLTLMQLNSLLIANGIKPFAILARSNRTGRNAKTNTTFYVYDDTTEKWYIYALSCGFLIGKVGVELLDNLPGEKTASGSVFRELTHDPILYEFVDSMLEAYPGLEAKEYPGVKWLPPLKVLPLTKIDYDKEFEN